MATYTFRAVDIAGVPAQGELDAGSKQAVTDELRQRGLIVLDIVEQKTSVTSQDLFDRCGHFFRLSQKSADSICAFSADSAAAFFFFSSAERSRSEAI